MLATLTTRAVRVYGTITWAGPGLSAVEGRPRP